jgi:nucleoside-diphosphate-sugar epimerase
MAINVNMRGHKILVTGASGFLGAELVRQLHNGDVSVRATGRGKTFSNPNIEYYQADILDPAQIAVATRDIHTVVHVAGLAHVFAPDRASAYRFQLVNEIGTANVMRSAVDHGAQHFILIGSVSVYGPFTNGICKEGDPCRPAGPYAQSKYNAEQRVLELAESSGMAVTILRLSTLYGEGDRGNVDRLMRWIDKRCFIWLGRGENRKSLLYKGDAARACLLAAFRPASGISIYSVSAPPCTMRDIVDGLARALGRKYFPGRVPASLALLATSFLRNRHSEKLNRLHSIVEKWLNDDVYDTRLFEEEYNFRAETSLSEGLKRQVAWHRRAKIAEAPALSWPLF